MSHFTSLRTRRPGRRLTSRRPRRFTPARLSAETLEARQLLAADLLQNPAQVSDVNADGVTSPLDALLVINELNTAGARSLRSGTPPAQAAFYDVNGDDFLTPIDALIVLNELNGEGEGDDLVRMRVSATDAEGNPIDSIDVGQTFLLQVFVQDLTAREDGGVFAGYLDVEFEADLASVSGNIQHSSSYGNAPSGDTSVPGVIDEAGSIDGLMPLGPDELLLFSVPMTAANPGTVMFAPNPADLSPAHDVLVFGIPEGESSPIVPPDRIMFVGDTLNIGGIVVPTAVDDRYDALENTTLVVDAAAGVLANDVDPSGLGLQASLVADANSGTVQLAADGSFSYTPNVDFVGIDSFTYVATAGETQSNVATVTIEVAPANDPPVAVDDAFSTDEDTVLNETGGVLINDSDPDGDPLTIASTTQPGNGTLSMETNGRFTYTPAANFFGTDTFQYTVTDGSLESNVATVTITVEPVNDAPLAMSDTFAVAQGGLLMVAASEGVLANDTDVDGDSLTAQLVSGPANGSLTLNDDGSFTYSPAAEFSGTDSFVYVASDGELLSDETTVTINVAGEIQVRIRLETANLFGSPIDSIAPGGEFLLRVFVQDVGTLPQDGVFAAYMDVMYDATLVSVSGPIAYGEHYPNQQSGDTSTPGLIDEAGAFDGLSPLGDGELLLLSVPFQANQQGTALFTTDPADLLPAHDTLLFNENSPVPIEQIEFGSTQLQIIAGDPPVAQDDAFETDEDTPLSVDAANGVLANDSDPDNDTLSAVLVGQATNGNVTLNADGSFLYTPNANFFGQDAFTYQASDGAQRSNVATVTIEVDPVDDPPVAVDDRYQTVSAGPLVVGPDEGVLQNDFDIEGDPLSVVLVDGPSSGTLQLSEDGSFQYVPAEGFIGRDRFTYQVEAGGQTSNTAEVIIDVGDLSPSSVSGFVYNDTDNDGRLDDHELRYGNVEITLSGNDLLGRDVFLTTQTGSDGSYRFDDVLRGNYTLTEFQPMFTIDGKDTIDGQLSLRNDRFQIDLPGGVDAGGYNFGERGLEPRFINNGFFFASRTDEGVLLMVDAAGRTMWYSPHRGWSDFSRIRLELAPNRVTAELTVAGAEGPVQTSTIRVLGNRNVRMVGNAEEGFLVTLKGNPADFGITIDRGPLPAEAVDAAFGQ